MANTTFNFMGFLIAHQRGKDLDKKDRNKNSLLSAFVPSDNIAGILTPLALVDKEVAKKEKSEVESENLVLKNQLNQMDLILLRTVEEATPLDTPKRKGDYLLSFMKTVYPNLKAANLDTNPFFNKIDDNDLRKRIREDLDK